VTLLLGRWMRVVGAGVAVLGFVVGASGTRGAGGTETRGSGDRWAGAMLNLNEAGVSSPHVVADGLTARYLLAANNAPQLFWSEDLVTWRGRKTLCEFPQYTGVSGMRMLVHRGKYYLSATLTNETRVEGKSEPVRVQRIVVLRADVPEGPFKAVAEPLVPAEWEARSGSVTVVEGKPYLVLVRSAGEGAIEGVELTDDLTKTAGEPFTLLKPPLPQEEASITDPTLFRPKGGKLLLAWTISWWKAGEGNFRLEQAVSGSDKPAGPWTQAAAPLLAKEGGEFSLFERFDGTPMVYMYQFLDGSKQSPFAATYKPPEYHRLMELEVKDGALAVKRELPVFSALAARQGERSVVEVSLPEKAVMGLPLPLRVVVKEGIVELANGTPWGAINPVAMEWKGRETHEVPVTEVETYEGPMLMVMPHPERRVMTRPAPRRRWGERGVTEMAAEVVIPMGLRPATGREKFGAGDYRVTFSGVEELVTKEQHVLLQMPNEAEAKFIAYCDNDYLRSWDRCVLNYGLRPVDWGAFSPEGRRQAGFLRMLLEAVYSEKPIGELTITDEQIAELLPAHQPWGMLLKYEVEFKAGRMAEARRVREAIRARSPEWEDGMFGEIEQDWGLIAKYRRDVRK
jgi:hypothetical protein